MHVPTHRAIGTRLKEKFTSGLEAAGGGVESGLRASGTGQAATGPVRPSSECATSCSSFEWIRARFAGTTTAFDARFGGADGAGASAWTLAARAATGTTTGGANSGGAAGATSSGGRATTGGAIEVEGKENDTADTARAATGAGAMELAITGRAFEAMMVGVATPPSGVSICMAS